MPVTDDRDNANPLILEMEWWGDRISVVGLGFEKPGNCGKAWQADGWPSFWLTGREMFAIR
jgi:hypothetical protein